MATSNSDLCLLNQNRANMMIWYWLYSNRNRKEKKIKNKKLGVQWDDDEVSESLDFGFHSRSESASDYRAWLFSGSPFHRHLGPRSQKAFEWSNFFFFFFLIDYCYQYGLSFLYSIPVLKALSFLFLQIVFRWFFTYSILPSSPPILLKLLHTATWSRCMYACSYNS